MYVGNAFELYIIGEYYGNKDPEEQYNLGVSDDDI
jgi:hypothetical protein